MRKQLQIYDIKTQIYKKKVMSEIYNFILVNKQLWFFSCKFMTFFLMESLIDLYYLSTNSQDKK